MNKYFANAGKDSRYFEDLVTSSSATRTPIQHAKRQTVDEAKAVFEKVISSYGAKSSGVVRRRYGIK